MKEGRFRQSSRDVASVPGGGITDMLDELADALAERIAARLAKRLAPSFSAEAVTPLLTPQEAASLVRVPKSWLMSKARSGALRSRKCGHYRRFDRQELVEDIERLTDRDD